MLVCWNSSNRLNYPVSLAVRQSQVSKTINQSKLPNRFKNSRVPVKTTFTLYLTLSATLCMIYKVAEHFILFMFYRNFLFFFLEHVGELCIFILRRKGGKNPYNVHPYTLGYRILCCSWTLSFLVRFRALFGAACHIMLNSCSKFGAACRIVLTLLVGLYDFAGQCLASVRWSSPRYRLLRVRMVVLIR